MMMHCARSQLLTMKCPAVVWNFLLPLVFSLLLDRSSATESISYILYRSGVRYQYEMGDLHAALRAYQQADDAITSWDMTQYDFTGMYNDVGIIHSRMGEYDLALKAYQKALVQDPTHLNALANMAALKASLGDMESADALYLKGSEVAQVTIEFMHNYGVHLSNTGRRHHGLEIFKNILEVNPSFYQSRTEVAKHFCLQDNMQDSYMELELALAAAAEAGDLPIFWQTYFVYTTSTPVLFPTTQFGEEFRSFYLHNLYEALTLIPEGAVDRPDVNLGCSYLGYYLIYQGFSDLVPRQLFSRLLQHTSRATLYPPQVDSNSLLGDVEQHSSNSSPFFSAVSASLPPLDNKKVISVGFLGSFCSLGGPEHSVTLLTKGVMKNLDRSRFRVTMLSVAGNMNEEECVLNYQFVDLVVLPKFSVNPAGAIQQIVDMQLDILVYTEIGMSHDIFFLAQSRLAKRSLSFWGHAITSGIVDFAYFNEANLTRRDGRVRGGPDYFISSIIFEKCLESCRGEESCDPRHQQRHGDIIGSDQCHLGAQKKYSERLLLQEGMTTYFYHPPLPLMWNEIDAIIPEPRVVDEVTSTRISSLPDKLPFLAYFQSSGVERNFNSKSLQLRVLLHDIGSSEEDIRMYCVPQTLYKLSPGNIGLLKKLLQSDPSSLLVLLDGELSQPEQKQLIKNEFPSSVLRRIIFLRKLDQREYMTLLAISDVVLDTFPVGGGRSSFSIFSTGTPIILLYTETSILQLTYGMYEAMGVACKMCIAYNEESYIAASIQLMSNKTLQSSLRSDILKNKHRLFENRTVVDEWERMLQYVLSVPRPLPFASLRTDMEFPSSFRILNSSSDDVNRFQDIKRIYELSVSSSTDSPSSLEEWFEALPLGTLLAMNPPYSTPPVRLNSIRADSYSSTETALINDSKKLFWEGRQEQISRVAENDNNYSDWKAARFDEEGISLGILITHVTTKLLQTPQQKITALNKTINSLKLALGLSPEEGLSSRNIKEVLVVDDGTRGLSPLDKALLSSSFPLYHFIFERQKPSSTSNERKKWHELQALSSLVKLSQCRYLLLVPSHFIASVYPHMSPHLLEASRTFLKRKSFNSTDVTISNFSFVLRLALQIINGYTNISGTEERFGVKGVTGTSPACLESRECSVFRQAAHVVLLNSLASETIEQSSEKILYSSADCQRRYSFGGENGGYIRAGGCKGYVSQNSQVVAGRGPHCMCSVANESYLEHPTPFGGYIDEDIRDICWRENEKNRAFYLSFVDSIVHEPYRDFTCLLALFSEGARKKMNLDKSEVDVLANVHKFYLQPALWDVEAVSLVMQGLEKEFVVDEAEPIVEVMTTRNRHQKKLGKNARKFSLKERDERINDFYHARGDIVFDQSDSVEYQEERPHDWKYICQFVNITASADVNISCRGDQKDTKKRSASSSSSSRFVQRFLSSGVRVAYLSTELFSRAV